MKIWILIADFIVYCVAASMKAEERSIGSAGEPMANGLIDSDSFDCPCGCNVLQIRGSGSTQYHPKDYRCLLKPPMITNIVAQHTIICPCGCKFFTHLSTFVHLPKVNSACDNDHMGVIDNNPVECPCGCEGSVKNGVYWFDSSIHCDKAVFNSSQNIFENELELLSKQKQ